MAVREGSRSGGAPSGAQQLIEEGVRHPARDGGVVHLEVDLEIIAVERHARVERRHGLAATALALDAPHCGGTHLRVMHVGAGGEDGVAQRVCLGLRRDEVVRLRCPRPAREVA